MCHASSQLHNHHIYNEQINFLDFLETRLGINLSPYMLVTRRVSTSSSALPDTSLDNQILITYNRQTRPVSHTKLAHLSRKSSSAGEIITQTMIALNNTVNSYYKLQISVIQQRNWFTVHFTVNSITFKQQKHVQAHFLTTSSVFILSTNLQNEHFIQ